MQRHQMTYHIHIQGVGVAPPDERSTNGSNISRNESRDDVIMAMNSMAIFAIGLVKLLTSNTSKNPTEQETSNPQGNFQLGLEDWQNSVMMGTHEQNSFIARICL